MQGLFPCPFPNPVPGVSQSRSWRSQSRPGFSPIPFLAFPNPTSDLSARTAAGLPVFTVAPRPLSNPAPGRFFPIPFRLFPQSRFGRFFPTPLRPLSAPHGKRFSGGGPAGVPAWNPQALLPCAGGGPTRHIQTRPPVRPCGSGQAPKTRPPSAGGRLLYVSCGSRQKALPPRDGGRRAPPLGPSSSSPLRSGGPAGRFRPASGPNWNRFRVKIFVFAPQALTESLQNGIV